MDELEKKALEYHSKDGVPGKVSVVPTKPCRTAEDLALAYTPGVAKPVLKIAENSDDAYRYTSKGNLVAVISNGTAILGLGDRGALASKPVMEGKGVLFKRFADIDVFDIEVNEKDPERFIHMLLRHAAGIARDSELPDLQPVEPPPIGMKVPQIENGSKAAPLQLQELLPVRLGAAEDTVFRIDLVKVARQVALSRRRRHRHHRRTGEKEQPSAPSVHIPSPPCSRSRNDCGETPQNRRKLREK